MTTNLFIMTQLRNCQLFSKAVAFDHPQYKVRAYVLLLTDGLGGRKLHFNLYNGSLGATAKELQLEAFLANDAPANEQCPWSYVADAEQAEEKTRKNGYRQHHKLSHN